MSRSIWSFARLVALAVCLIFVALPARADAQDSAALNMVRQANSHYDEGQFRDALRLYLTAYDALKDVRLLYRIGLSYEQIGNYQRAREYLVHYLRADADSPVKGRVEAKIGQLRSLEENIQAFLAIETEPAGAEVYVHGYMGKAEGKTPVEFPVGAGENTVTLVFPAGQRLEVAIDVGAGQREERFFQVGTASAPPPPPQEVARAEEPPQPEPEQPQEKLKPEEERKGDGAEEQARVEADEGAAPDDEEAAAEGAEEDQEAVASAEDVIPMPGSERDPVRNIKLTRVDMGPPWWASTLGVILIIGGNTFLVLNTIYVLAKFDEFTNDEWLGHGIVWGASALSVGGGIYLMGRNWRRRLPRLQDLDFVPEGVGQPKPESGLGPTLMLRWSGRF